MTKQVRDPATPSAFKLIALSTIGKADTDMRSPSPTEKADTRTSQPTWRIKTPLINRNATDRFRCYPITGLFPFLTRLNPQ
ncbi:hypothetical protein HZ326_22257 [Fusarium oxysporum f. sp. albedinis]|nr:hypothetical protein HZ326_22257 [Fusarium oxysporum f. sp. albedinis]